MSHRAHSCFFMEYVSFADLVSANHGRQEGHSCVASSSKSRGFRMSFWGAVRGCLFCQQLLGGVAATGETHTMRALLLSPPNAARPGVPATPRFRCFGDGVRELQRLEF